MTEKNKKKFLKLAIEFIKLQLSANILFWGTIGGLFVLYDLLKWPQLAALATASIVAHVAFFIVNKEWVFDDNTGKRKTGGEVVRFVLFMGLNFFINLGIVMAASHYLSGIEAVASAFPGFDPTPYIGQVIAALFFTVWNFVGLKFWVFQDVKHHSLRTNYVKVKKGVTRHAKRVVRRVVRATQ
mgnify:CR=1 FL=1